MSRPASGTPFALAHGDYRADVASVGASLRTLTVAGRDLVRPYRADEVRPRFRGAVLAPWPNRVAYGRWTWRGAAHQLPITEPDRGHALHGLALWLDWQPIDSTGSLVTLTTTIWPQTGYPFLLDLEMTWRLGDDGLTGTLAATNGGDDDAPYGCSIHPYLVAPAGRVDDWTVHIPAGRRLEVDDVLVPTHEADPPPDADFRTAHRIGDVFIDHAYTGIAFDADGTSAVELTDRDGTGVRMRFGRELPWLQIHTGDLPGTDAHRAGLAVEPMTSPPDAFNRGTDLLTLAPGERHVSTWLIAAL